MNECKLIVDLLPLYEEELVSQDTAQWILEHAAACENCRKQLERCGTEIPPLAEPDPHQLKKGLRRDARKMILRGFTGIFGCFAVFMGMILFLAWVLGYFPIAKEFVSPSGNSRIDLVDYRWSGRRFFGLTPMTDDSGYTYLVYESHTHPPVMEGRTGAGTGMHSTSWVKFEQMDVLDWSPDENWYLYTAVLDGTSYLSVECIDWDESLYGDFEQLSAMYARPGHICNELEALCRSNPDFPAGWNTITFRYSHWQEDVFTLTFLYETDNGLRGLVDYNFLDGFITRID